MTRERLATVAPRHRLCDPQRSAVTPDRVGDEMIRAGRPKVTAPPISGIKTIRPMLKCTFGG